MILDRYGSVEKKPEGERTPGPERRTSGADRRYTHGYCEPEETGAPTLPERHVVTRREPDGRLSPGFVLQDTYCIDRLLATGGMGDVYRATHRRLDGAFAVKVLHRELLREEGLLARFRTEAQIMASLRHPNIVQVFDFNVLPDGTPYLVMELVEGQDLRNIMAERRTLTPHRVAQIVKQTASALGAAHAHGVIHRDLKPENVMLVPIEGQDVCVKVVDFGVSKTRGAQRITIQPSAVIGTPEYMSPEQAEGRNDEVDHRADQFALGVLAYTLLAGHEPFRGQTPVAVLYQVVHQDAAPLRHFVTWPCNRIEEVLARAMAKHRSDRFATIIEFARAFEEAVTADLADEPRPDLTPQLPVTPAVSLHAVPPSDSSLDDDDLDVAFEERPTGVGRDRPAPGPRTSWRVAAMLVSAACVAAATLALGGAAQNGHLTLTGTSERVMAAYDTLTDGAAKLWRQEFAAATRD
jgi:serine/threonine protein kinase